MLPCWLVVFVHNTALIETWRNASSEIEPTRTRWNSLLLRASAFTAQIPDILGQVVALAAPLQGKIKRSQNL